jgi:hypothetical protein
LRDLHEGLDGAVCGKAATEEKEAVASEEALQDLGNAASVVDVAVVAIGGVIFGFVEHAFGGVIEVAVELEEVTLSSGDGAEEGTGLASPCDFLDERLGVGLIDFFEHAVEVGGDGGVVEKLWQQGHRSGDFFPCLEVALEVEVEAVYAELGDEVIHHALVVAIFFEADAHDDGVEGGVSAEIEEILLPLGTTGTLGHAGADEGDDEAALAGAFEFVEAGKIARELIRCSECVLSPPGRNAWLPDRRDCGRQSRRRGWA